MQPRHKSKQQQHQPKPLTHNKRKQRAIRTKRGPTPTLSIISTPKRLVVTIINNPHHHHSNNQPHQQISEPHNTTTTATTTRSFSTFTRHGAYNGSVKSPTAFTKTSHTKYHHKNHGFALAHPIAPTTPTTALPTLVIPSLAFSSSAKRPAGSDQAQNGNGDKNSNGSSSNGDGDSAPKWYTTNKIYKMYKRYGKLAIVSVAGVYAAGFIACTTIPLLIPGYDPQAAIGWLNENGYIPQMAKDAFAQVTAQYPQIGEPIKQHPDIASKILAGYLLNEMAVLPRLAIALTLTKTIGDKRIKAQEQSAELAKTQQQNL